MNKEPGVGLREKVMSSLGDSQIGVGSSRALVEHSVGRLAQLQVVSMLGSQRHGLGMEKDFSSQRDSLSANLRNTTTKLQTCE